MDLKGKFVDLTFVNGDEEIFGVISIQDGMVLVENKSGFKTLIPLSAILRMDILNLFFRENQN